MTIGGTAKAQVLDSCPLTHVTIPYDRCGFLLVSYSNFVCNIFDFKNAVTLKTGLRAREGH